MLSIESKLALQKHITDGILGENPPAAGGHGDLSAKPLAAAPNVNKKFQNYISFLTCKLLELAWFRYLLKLWLSIV